MNHKKQAIVVGGIIALVLVAIMWERITYGGWFRNSASYVPGPRPVCYMFLNAIYVEWIMATGSNCYPNVEGDAKRSLAAFGPQRTFGDPRFKDYAYIPGLCERDPDELIIFYKTTKTKFREHGANPCLWRVPFLQSRWSVCGPRFDGPEHGGAYWINTPEFKMRLIKTLDFLKSHDRPYWQAVVDKHTAFLESIDE